MTNVELSIVFSETARSLNDAYSKGHLAGQIDLHDVIEILDTIAEKINDMEREPCN